MAKDKGPSLGRGIRAGTFGKSHVRGSLWTSLAASFELTLLFFALGLLTRFFFLLMIACVFMVGCKCGPSYPKEMVFEVQKNSARMKQYVELMGQKKTTVTTAEQDQKMIQANLKAWLKLWEVVSK